MRSTSATRGLGQVEPTGTNTLIAYAAKAGSTAEDGDGNHSPFTTALLENLIVPGLDVRLAFGRVRDEVLKITGRRQEPFVYGSLGGGKFRWFRRRKSRRSKSQQGEERLCVGRANRNQKAWKVFLDTYPDGFYADLARAQLAKLNAAPPPEVMAKLEPAAKPPPPEPTSDERGLAQNRTSTIAPHWKNSSSAIRIRRWR